PGLVATGWLGLHAPAATPPAAIARLNAAAAGTLHADPLLRERLQDQGLFLAEAGPPAAFAAHLAQERERLAALLARIGLRPGP
ncbi:tripartite tricarboxylate transporter substrate binding protein, partial [Roseomonas alkaliterrae]